MSGRSPAGGPWRSMLAPDRWPLAAIAALAIAIQIQITLPLGVDGIRLNAADPLAGILALLLLAGWIRNREQGPRWRFRLLVPALAALTVLLTMALILGRLRLGEWSSWALFNRYAGWFVLLCYLAAGTWLVRKTGRDGTGIFAAMFTAAAGVLLLFPVARAVFLSWGVDIFPMAESQQMTGAMGNPNALAFVCIVAIAGLLVRSLPIRLPGGEVIATILLSVLLLAVLYTGSRAAWLATVIGLGAGAMTGMLMLRRLAMALVPAVLVATLPLALGLGGQTGPGTPGQVMAARLVAGFETDEVSNVSANERLRLAQSAIGLWQEYPVAGAGLGVFLVRQEESGDRVQAIHNSALWILTEMGIPGAVLFGAAFVGIAIALWSGGAARARDPTVAWGFLVLVIFAVMAMFHDILYQRVFWLVLGLTLALPSGDRERTDASE